MLSTKKHCGSSWILDEEKFLTAKEMKKLLMTCSKAKERALRQHRKTPVKDCFLIRLATETGLRVQEMADLSCGDLHISSSRASVLVRRGKGGRKRVIRVRDQFAETARQYLQWKKDIGDAVNAEAPLFSSNKKRMTKRALQKSFKRSIAKAGIHQPKGVGIHSLRHTYASFLLRASNFNLRLVQRQLGHQSVKTTEVYTHLLGEDINRALKRLYA